MTNGGNILPCSYTLLQVSSEKKKQTPETLSLYCYFTVSLDGDDDGGISGSDGDDYETLLIQDYVSHALLQPLVT